MQHILPALVVMIVRIIVYVVQQNRENSLQAQHENEYRRFIRSIKHPAEFELR